jgi:hypothetical protein
LIAIGRISMEVGGVARAGVFLAQEMKKPGAGAGFWWLSLV